MRRSPASNPVARLWLNLPLPVKGAAIVSIPVICTIGMSLLLVTLQSRFEAANHSVIHTEQVLSKSGLVLSKSLSTEATARGYLLAREPAFLELHRRARTDLAAALTELNQLVADNPDQQLHVASARRIIDEEITALDLQLASPSGADLSAAVNASRRRIDTIKAGLDDFDAEERRLLARREEQIAQSRQRLRWGIWGFCLVGIVAAIAGSQLFTNGVTRRLERIAENASRFARRESSGPIDAGSDAIRSLEEALISTSRIVLEREQRLVENAAELEEAKTRAEDATRAKTEFLSTMSHEIRSPMNAILGAADLLARTPLSPQQSEYLRILNRAGINLLGVVNDVLDLSKIEAGRIELERITFDCAALAEAVFDIASVSAKSKGLQFQVMYRPTAPRRVIGDPERLQQVLLNLASNAIKFTEKGGVTIHVGPADTPGLLHFAVSDTGIGIPPDRLGVIFQSFTQAEASITRRYGGTGLGLSICERLVDLMGGRIWVESEQGEGSTFHFTAVLPEAAPASVPDTVAAPPPETQPAMPLGAGLGGRVLLAEDNQSSVALVQAYLAGTSCQLTVAADGAAALEYLTRDAFNVVLMDVRMPKLDGYEVIRQFRDWERAQGRPRTPVIALTANAFQEDLDNAIKAGADGHLSKPIRAETLLEAIEIYQRPDDAPDVRVAVPDYIRELAPEFLRRQRQGLFAVLSDLKAGTFDSIQSFAHNMKGCGRSFGFDRLTEIGRDMEQAAKDRDADLLRRQMLELREYLTTVDIA